MNGVGRTGVKAAAWPRPTWQVPYPYGFAAALDSAGTIAAPLLAGFSITLIGLVVASPNKMRWPDEALALLTGAAVLLILAVQCAYSARQYIVGPDELAAWWPDISHDERSRQVRREQWGHFNFVDLWAKRFRRSFHAGLVLMLASLALILVPAATDDGGAPVAVSAGRYVAIAIAAAGSFAELAWLALNWLADRSFAYDATRRRRFLIRLVDGLIPLRPEATPPDLEGSDASG